MNKKVMNVLNGKSYDVPPIWLMRQAGRYLPEYKETRKRAGNFLNLCYTPELATEVTLQPIDRFGFDASILFSDILVIPDAIGRKVRFVEGEGPRLEPITAQEINSLVDQFKSSEEAIEFLTPVFEAVKSIRGALPDETTFLGFCGAPWTVATYIIAGRGTPDQAPTRTFSYQHPVEFEKLLNLLADVSADYLITQLKSGADAVQLFDSWSGVLGNSDFENWCIKPVKRIVDKVRKEIPDAKIIGFPKGAGFNYLDYKNKTGVDALSLDWTIPFKTAQELQKECPIQGNLDPLRLLVGGDALNSGIDTILEHFANGPFIFNLGHGITPQVPIKHVEDMIKRIRG
ncbi:MAG: uroporphyrinogen decarboxylase [Nitratireductor sp.]